MISAVSNVSFGETSASNLINSPGLYSSQVAAEIPDTYEPSEGKKKSAKGAVLTTALLALAAFAGLGYMVKTNKLAKVDIAEGENFFKKIWLHTKNAGAKVGEWAESCYNTIAGWFTRSSNKAK